MLVSQEILFLMLLWASSYSRENYCEPIIIIDDSGSLITIPWFFSRIRIPREILGVFLDCFIACGGFVDIYFIALVGYLMKILF